MSPRWQAPARSIPLGRPLLAEEVTDDVLSEDLLFFFVSTTCHSPPFTSLRESRGRWAVGTSKAWGRLKKARLAFALASSRILQDLTHAGCGPPQFTHLAWLPCSDARIHHPDAQKRRSTRTVPVSSTP